MPYCWESHAPAFIDFNSFSSTTTKLAWNIWASTQANLSLGVSEQRRRRPACASAQSDQRLCYSRFVKYNIYACYQWNFIFLASLCRRGDWFETRFVGNPEDIFFSRRGPYHALICQNAPNCWHSNTHKHDKHNIREPEKQKRILLFQQFKSHTPAIWEWKNPSSPGSCLMFDCVRTQVLVKFPYIYIYLIKILMYLSNSYIYLFNQDNFSQNAANIWYLRV